MTFKVGDKVKCVDTSGSSGELYKDKEYVVDYLREDGKYLRVKGCTLDWFPERFELVQESQNVGNPSPFKAGDKIRCIRKSDVGYAGKVGQIYTVKECNGSTVFLQNEEEEFGCMSNRFELVTEPSFKIGDEVYHIKDEKVKYIINHIDSKGYLGLIDYGRDYNPSFFRHWPKSLSIETPEVSPEVSEELSEIYKERGDNMRFKVGDIVKNNVTGNTREVKEVSVNGNAFNSGDGFWLHPLDYTLVSSKGSKMNSIKSFPKTAAMYTGSAIWRLVKHQANYWVKEPFLLICFKIMRAVRFVVMTAVMAASVAGGVYTYQNADYVKAEVGKYLPTVTIQAPEKSL